MRGTSGRLMHFAVIIACIGVLICGVPVYADEVIDSINEALHAYQKGDFSEAAGNLDYAAQLIRQKRSSDLKDHLPAPLPGWTAEEASSQAVSPAMFGGMISAERRYVKDASSVTATITTESPMLQGMMMMFTNPMLATSGGAKLKKINGQKAIIKYDQTTRQGDINIIVAKSVLVTIQGTDVNQEDLIAYASAFDYKKLEEL